jgi:hypothetical protein
MGVVVGFVWNADENSGLNAKILELSQISADEFVENCKLTWCLGTFCVYKVCVRLAFRKNSRMK